MKDKKEKEKIITFLNKHHEDVMISLQKVIYIDKPTFKEAIYFGMETVYNDKSFGIHRIWKHFTEEEMNKTLKRYPEIKELIELNK